MYYVIALGLFRAVSAREVLRCLVEGLRWLPLPVPLRVPGKSSISRARARLGVAPFEVLREERVRPVGERGTRGVWYREWRLIGFDGSTLNVADEARNREAFGLPGNRQGRSAFPQVRLTGLMELGTRACIGWTHGPIRESEIVQAERLLESVVSGDVGDGGPELWGVSAVAAGDGYGRGPAVADSEPAPAAGPTAPGRRLLSERVPGEWPGPQPQPRRLPGPGGCLPSCRWGRRGVSAGNHGARPGPGAGGGAGRASTTNVGKSRPATTKSSTTCSAPALACAARPRSWCARKSRDCCWPITPSAISCIRPRARRTKTPTTFPSCTPCGSCAVGCWWPAIFPPQLQIRRLVHELLEERVVSSRGQRKPRGVRRKSCPYPIRPRGPVSSRRHHWSPQIIPANA